VAHGAGSVPDVEEADLSELDAREAVRDEGIDARLADLDIEDAATAGRDDGRLDEVLRGVDEIGVQPGAPEDGADDVELCVETRPCVDDPEADGLSRSAASGCVLYWEA
jgi:hypothetical protein